MGTGGSAFRLPSSLKPQASSLFACCLLAALASPAYAQLEVTGIEPAYAHNYEPLADARVSGSGIIGGATVKLLKGDLEIPGTNLIFDGLPNSFRATFDLGDDSCYSALEWCALHPEDECPDPDCFAPAGDWDLVITNPGGGETATLAGGFRVLERLKIKPVGVFGGKISKTVVVGNLAYVGRGTYLVILDVSDPANIVELGRIDLVSSVRDLDVEGAYAFVCTRLSPHYFCVVDVSDPAHPELVVSGMTVNNYFTSAVLVHGNTAYVGLGEDTPGQFDVLYAVDVTDPPSMDPSDPGLFHRVEDPGASDFYTGGAAVAGDFLYAFAEADPGSGRVKELKVFDLSADPLNPAQRASVVIDDSDHHGSQVAVEGSLVYVAVEAVPYTLGYHLGVIDASNPDFPFMLARHEDFSGDLAPGQTWRDLEVSNGTAHITTGSYSLLDVSDPFSPPPVLSEFQPSGVAEQAVTVVGSTVYLADTGEGLNVLDVSDPANPIIVGNYPSPAYMRRMVQRADLLYVTDRHLGVTILDVSDARHPVVLAQHRTGTGPNPATFPFFGAHGIAERDGLLYVGAYYGGIEVLDVTDPANPFLAGGLEFAPDCYSIALDLFGDLAIVGRKCSGNWSEIVVFDVSDIQNMVELEAFLMDCYGCGSLQPIAIETMPDGTIHPGLRRQTCYGSASLAGLSLKHIGDKLYFSLGTSLRIFREDNVDPLLLCLGDASCWGSAVGGSGGGVGVPSPDRAYVTGSGLWALDTSVPPGEVPITLGSSTDFDYSGYRSILDAEAEGLYAYATAPAAGSCTATVNALTVYQAAIPGDLEDDDDVDLADFAGLQRCFGGDGVEPLDADCLVFDFDDDFDVDLDDLGGFATALTGPLTGACCLPDGTASGTGACIEVGKQACTAAGGGSQGTGAYRGSGTRCATVTCAPQQVVVYGNRADSGWLATAGPGLILADDLELDEPGARELNYLELAVCGGGGGAFDVTVSLYTDCPGDGGTQIAGTEFTFTDIPDSGYCYILEVDPIDPPVTIPDTVWMVAEFSTPESAWFVTGQQAWAGFTADIFGRNDPPWVCNYYFGGDPYAAFYAKLKATFGTGGRSATSGDGEAWGTQLHVTPMDCDASPAIPAVQLAPFDVPTGPRPNAPPVLAPSWHDPEPPLDAGLHLAPPPEGE